MEWGTGSVCVTVCTQEEEVVVVVSVWGCDVQKGREHR